MAMRQATAARVAPAKVKGGRKPAKANPKPKPAWLPADGPVTVELGPDGDLTNPDLEELAQIVADDVTSLDAWRAMGKSNDGSPGAKRRFAEKHPVFNERLEALRKERADLIAEDPLFGEISWMAKQLWRAARAKNDPKLMMEAAKLSFDVAKQRAGGRPGPADADLVDEGEKRPVGRPVRENPAAIRDPMVIRAKLVSYGQKIDQSRQDPSETDD